MLWCRCPCHDERSANLREAEHRGNLAAVAYYATDDHLRLPPLADITSQLDTLVAIGCSCIAHHASLPMPRPPYKPPTNWTPGDD